MKHFKNYPIKKRRILHDKIILIEVFVLTNIMFINNYFKSLYKKSYKNSKNENAGFHYIFIQEDFENKMNSLSEKIDSMILEYQELEQLETCRRHADYGLKQEIHKLFFRVKSFVSIIATSEEKKSNTDIYKKINKNLNMFKKEFKYLIGHHRYKIESEQIRNY